MWYTSLVLVLRLWNNSSVFLLDLRIYPQSLYPAVEYISSSHCGRRNISSALNSDSKYVLIPLSRLWGVFSKYCARNVGRAHLVSEYILTPQVTGDFGIYILTPQVTGEFGIYILISECISSLLRSLGISEYISSLLRSLEISEYISSLLRSLGISEYISSLLRSLGISEYICILTPQVTGHFGIYILTLRSLGISEYIILTPQVTGDFGIYILTSQVTGDFGIYILTPQVTGDFGIFPQSSGHRRFRNISSLLMSLGISE